MIPALYIAKTGLNAAQSQLDVISNNLANASTNGFKKSKAVFEDLLYQTTRQPGAMSSAQTNIPSGVQIGTGVRLVATTKNHSQGSLQQTGNPLDLAINGSGFFQVQMPDGSVGYTRDGSFQRDNQGQLVTNNGYPLMPNITVPADIKTLTISNNGMVSVVQEGSNNPITIGEIQLSTFVNPSGLQSVGENLYTETGASGQAQQSQPGTNGAGTVTQNYVEASNVNPVEELVAMIQAQRSYELNTKVITTADQMLQKLGTL